LTQTKARRPSSTAEKLHIGLVQARFNEGITNTLAAACRAELIKLGVQEAHIHHVLVPGALEVPLALQGLADRSDYDALIALGCIIRGETYHFELVSNEQGAGITRVTLDTGVPIANGILTTEDDDQALSRMQVKGADCAQAAVEMARLLKAPRAPSSSRRAAAPASSRCRASTNGG